MALVQGETGRRYRDDNVFQMINKRYLSLENDDRRIYNTHMKQVIEDWFLSLMKRDELFNLMFKRIMYGGSFYKGTRYGKPDEFDLDLIIELPIDYNYIKVEANHNDYGYVKFKIDPRGCNNPKWLKHNVILSRWITPEGYLNQNKFRAWMEKVFTTVFRDNARLMTDRYTFERNGTSYHSTHRKSGPAFTMLVTIPGGSKIDVDIVPCLEFKTPLGHGYRPLRGDRNTWMAVAKPLSPTTANHEILWRLCFYENEKDNLARYGGPVKPIIKMLKKFRTTMNWKMIASYHIETIFYHEIENNLKDIEKFTRSSQTELFILGLNKLQKALETQRLPYFWHPNHNLFGKMSTIALKNYADNLRKAIAKLDSQITIDRYALADLVLTKEEALIIRQNRNEIIPDMVVVPREPIPSAGPQSQNNASLCAIL